VITHSSTKNRKKNERNSLQDPIMSHVQRTPLCFQNDSLNLPDPTFSFSLVFFCCTCTMWSVCNHVHFLVGSRSFVDYPQLRGFLYLILCPQKMKHSFFGKKCITLSMWFMVDFFFVNYLFDIFVIWFS